MPRYYFPTLAVAASATATAEKPPRLNDPTQTELEKSFPHILQAIQTMWGYRELNLYFVKLAIDLRGDRKGFPAEVWDDLYMLMQLHQNVFPWLET